MLSALDRLHRRHLGRLFQGATFTVALCCVWAVPSRGQRVVPTLDVGGSRVRYADSLSSSAATLSPAVRVDWDRATFGAFGTYSQFGGGWSTQGALDLSLYTSAMGPLVGELSGSTGGSAHEDGTRTGESIVLVRAHLMQGQVGAWAGAGAGATWDGAEWNAVRQGEVAAWIRGGAATALGTLTPTQVADSIRFADAELAVRLELAHADLGLTAGHRVGDRLPTLGGSASSWASLTTTAWVAPTVALVASVGTYPVDFTQGYPGGRFVSLGVRFGSRAARHADRVDPGSDRTRSLSAEPRAGVIEFRVLASAGGRRTIRVRATGTRSVEIAGDFTGWKAVPLAQAGNGWWSVTVPIAPGTHQVNLRVDGQTWIAPPGLIAVNDEFGGVVGVLTVP